MLRSAMFRSSAGVARAQAVARPAASASKYLHAHLLFTPSFPEAFASKNALLTRHFNPYSARFNSTAKDHGGTYDTIYDDVQIEKGESRRAFTYLTLGGARFLYATGARLAAMKFVASWSASADVLALAAMEIDISKIDPATCVTVKWRGKPVFIRSRTEEEISAAVNVDMSELKDPETDEVRLADPSRPEWLIVLGVCTHLGCVPLPNQGNYKGWFCPCHGSHYDTSGRIRKGPAPLNLEVPPTKFLSETLLRLG